MPPQSSLRISSVTLDDPKQAAAFLNLSQEYFAWMEGEILRASGLPLAEIVGMSREAYVRHTVEIARTLVPDHASLYFLHAGDEEPAGMGGLRRLPDGAAEIVRIYTRPALRGRGCGRLMVSHLVSEAARQGHDVLRLDTATFMTSAHRIYEAAGFARRGPYPGAEPPPVLEPYWIYMERPLTPAAA